MNLIATLPILYEKGTHLYLATGGVVILIAFYVLIALLGFVLIWNS